MSDLKEEFPNKRKGALEEMEIGERIKWDIFDVWRVHTGWLFGVDAGDKGVTLTFVPDVLNVESHTTNHY